MSGPRRETPCSGCGYPVLPADARFCPGCGGRLPSEAPAAAPSSPAAGAGRAEGAHTASYTPEHLRREVLTTRSALEGERKHVAVLLVDVVESLAMAEALDPEEVHELMEGFFGIALDVVHRHGGTINQFRGDGFMALFGAPRARGEEPQRAVRAALALAEACTAYGGAALRRYGVPLLLRSGIHAGLVWVGSIGTARRRDYTAEGATVGVAARLEGMAEPGQILVSASVARAVAARVRTRDLGPRRLKGVREPVRVFQVLGPAEEGEAGPGREASCEGSQPPFRGRRRELARIERQRQALGEAGACLVELRGPAGAGKSRLLAELVARAAARGEPFARGASREEDASRAFAAWLDLLERAENFELQAPAPRALARALRRGAIGPGPDAVEAAVRGLLEQSWSARTVALAFDDAQWMDPSSRQLAERLLARPPRQGLLLVVSSREEDLHRWEAASRIHLPLPPLGPDDTRALVEPLLPGEPELARLVEARSGGNPLFALELARSLQEGSQALRRAARAEALLSESPVRLPESVHATLAARIDRLPDPTKRLLQAASVVGGPFDAALLERMGAREEDELAPRLAQLRAAGLLASVGAQLDFAHPLCRQVAYEQMLRARRRQLHGRLAELLEAELAAEDPYGASRAGHHWERAGRTDPAARLLARAGRIFLRRLAVGEAASHLRRAWEILAEEPKVDEGLRVEVGLHLAEALNDLDLSGEASAVLSRLPTAPVGELDPLPVAQALVHQGWVAFTEHERGQEGRALLERGLALAERCPEGAAVVGSACAFLIRVYHLEGCLERAIGQARRVAEIASGAGNRFGLVFGRGNEGYVRCASGDVAQGLALCQEAAVLAAEAEDRAARALALSWLTRAWVSQGDAARALEVAEPAVRSAKESGQVGAHYTTLLAMGEAHLLLGAPRRAWECFEELARINERWSSTRVQLALGHLELGRYLEAAELAEASLRRSPPRLHRLRLRRILALARGLGGDGGSAAEAMLTEVLSEADARGLRPLAAETLAALAELAARQRESEAAAYYLDRATQIWTACGMEPHAELARTSVEAR